MFILLMSHQNVFYDGFTILPPAMYEGFDLFISSPTFVIFHFVYYGHLVGMK